MRLGTTLRLLLIVCLPLLLPVTLAGQTVRGHVVEDGTARPLAGAFVVLVDDDGRRQHGVLTRSDGSFTLRTHAPGTYRLTAELIGYASTTTEPLHLVPGPATEHTIHVAVRAVSLEGISVSGTARCHRRPGAGPETARLWEEARKALEVARWSDAQRALRFVVVQHRRELDARTLRVVDHQQEVRSGVASRSPYRSRPATELEARGYIERDDDGGYSYYAPDADVLLSESFLATHCFRVAAAPVEEPSLIGLMFEPVPERELPDVQGVLWLDRGSGELRRLDFTYTDLPFPHGDWRAVGGRVEFERLATGMWIVRRWYIRMPLVAEERGGRGRRGREPVLTSLAEHGAEVRSILSRDGALLSEVAGATLYGVVRDSAGGAPLADAVVEVLATGRRASTGPDGAYRLTGLEGGRYAVRLGHPDLDALGIEIEPRTVVLVPGRSTRLPLALPTRAARARAARAQAEEVPRNNTLRGVVVDEMTGRPVGGAMIALRAGGDEVVGSAVSDARGRFLIPHPSRGDRYRLAVRHVGYGAIDGEVRFVDGEQLDVRVELSARAIALDPILVTGRRRGYLARMGFYDRRRSGAGTFIDRAEIERRVPSKVTDLLGGRPRLRVLRTAQGEDVRVAGSGYAILGGDCQPAVWIDGALVRNGGPPQTELLPGGVALIVDPLLTDLIDPSAIEAIEIYRSAAELPAEFGGSGAGCGVLVIWTRHD